MSSPRSMPIRYSADIQTPGQCRGNLKAWRGVWTLALSAQPPDTSDDEEEETVDRKDTTEVAVDAVLTHRASTKATRETRFFGKAVRQYLCGNYLFVSIDWRYRKNDVPVREDLGVSAEDLGAEGWRPAGIGADDASVGKEDEDKPCRVADADDALRHSFLIRPGSGVELLVLGA
eukprot:gnl/TRDRNA2_/TRDRNA2_100966_c0_seq2.p1 gnl/TRDRNA2_/TRDRNA2_100966_c0~~gnl/TRDRNA2_/TRDRNA2_100966_c0_seq2.p1  ORF type:complete len:183 (-),score=22.06 gnl/TRDRNA2_/TRDRNA2_100966_c0_seq2:269-793(-)